MPMLYPTGWVGGKKFHQGLLNGANRNKVILYSPYGTLMAIYMLLKKKKTLQLLQHVDKKL